MLALANPNFGGAERVADSNQRPIITNQRPIITNLRPLITNLRPLITNLRPIITNLRPIITNLRPGAGGGSGIKPLPGTQAEADAIHADFPSARIHTGKQAQESTAKAEAPRHRYLHFATHGLLNDKAPLESAIVLAQPPAGSAEDGLLTAREIFDLNWPADLVVLSACNTARGEQTVGEGVVGLSWALFVAGVPSQVLSQWAVADASTAQLMKGLYSNLKAGRAKGDALRRASLSLMKDGQHAHPFYWAPFVLIGDWR